MGLFGSGSESNEDDSEKSLDELRSELEQRGGAGNKSIPDDYNESENGSKSESNNESKNDNMADERNVEKLIQNARHKSVNQKRLTNLKGGLTTRYLYDKPLIDYLEEDEQPHYILAARQKAPKFSGSDSPSWGGSNLRGMAMHLITDQRWLIVAGDKPSDHTFEIPIGEIAVTDHSTGMNSHKIDIKTSEQSIEIPIGNMYNSTEIESVVEYLAGIPSSITIEFSDHPFEMEGDDLPKPTKGHSHFHICKICNQKNTIWYSERPESQDLIKCGSCGEVWEVNGSSSAPYEFEIPEEKFPIDIIDRTHRSDNQLYAKLIVPTKSSGATFTSQGWNVGGDVVRRTSSKGVVKENNWENYVKKLRIHTDIVEIGVTHGDLSLTSDNQIHQTIRINLSDITDVRVQRVEASTGFIFEAQDEVYQFKLTKVGKLSTASGDDANYAVRHLKNAIKQAPESDDSEENLDKDDGDDAIKKLSQLKELHDQGALTDEEFQEKKEELLDKI